MGGRTGAPGEGARLLVAAVLALAAAVAVVVVVVGGVGLPRTPAGPSPLCSGVPVSGDLSSPESTVEYEVHVPAGGTLRVEGTADINGEDTTGGWQTVLVIDPVVRAVLGSFDGGPQDGLAFSGSWTQGATGGVVPVTVSQRFGTEVSYRFTATVEGAAAGATGGACGDPAGDQG